MKNKKPSSVMLEFSNSESANIARQVLQKQLQNIGESEIGARAEGKTLKISISDGRESRRKAGIHSAKRLGKMLVETDLIG